ncbi:hypothetical protein BI001_gp211 [Bacillus phage Zuko]|uniref:hypothetical protein n=1 Tax=Bacillus phage Zuko TaxID=1805956 RepID=UPI0007A77832|nr:hypothetical protein BI001_gp211 [Bacillus phage Zuko]AMW62521.1 hypothetical protein ZUKO_167 [Bacillus phage Zuko]
MRKLAVVKDTYRVSRAFRFMATHRWTGEQFIKSYTLPELIQQDGYYGIIADMTGDSNRDNYVLRELPHQIKLPFYVFDPFDMEISYHPTQSVFADDNLIARSSVSAVLSGKQEDVLGWRLWYVGEEPPEHWVMVASKGDEYHVARTWNELGQMIDVSKQALSNGYRERRKVMGYEVYKKKIDLKEMVACFELTQEKEKCIDIIPEPCYDKEVENEESN